MLFGCPAATFFQFSMAYLTIGINMDKIKDSIMTTERFLTRWVGASSGQCDHPKVESISMKVIDMVEAQGSQPSLPTFESITKSYLLVCDINRAK